MIISRGLYLTRLSGPLGRNLLGKNNKKNVNHQIFRNSGGVWYYRKQIESSPTDSFYGNLMGGFLWWWIIWHLLTDFHELAGGHAFPNPSSWTDEELGIPPDD